MPQASDAAAAAAPHCRARLPHPSELLVTLDQVDPEVLAELPQELQAELCAALAGRPRASGARRGGRSEHGGSRGQVEPATRQGGRGAVSLQLCSQDPNHLTGPGHSITPAANETTVLQTVPAEVKATAAGVQSNEQQQYRCEERASVQAQQQQQHLQVERHPWNWQRIGLGRTWQQEQKGQQSRLFTHEPVEGIMSALRVAVPALVARRNVSLKATGQQQLASEDHLGCEGTSTLLPRQQQQGLAGVNKVSGGPKAHNEAAGVLPACVDGPDGGGHQQLEVLGEYLAQWLVEYMSDLISVRRVLQTVVKAGRQHVEFRRVAQQVVRVVQQRLQQRYGFCLALP